MQSLKRFADVRPREAVASGRCRLSWTVRRSERCGRSARVPNGWCWDICGISSSSQISLLRGSRALRRGRL